MKILCFNWNGVLNDVEEQLILRGHTILPQDGKESTLKKADLVITWCEMENGGWKEVILKAKKLGKKTLLVQHGRRGVSRIYPPFNEQLLSDAVCVWGPNDMKRIMEVGVPSDKIHITGCPLFKHLKPKVKHEGINVVFSPDHWDGDITENLIVASELEKVKDINIITKTVKGCQDPREYRNVVESDRHAKNHMEIVADVLSKADLVVSLSDATFELLAEFMDIPVVAVDLWIPKSAGGDDKYKEYVKPYSEACTRTRIREFLSVVKAELKNPSRLAVQREIVAMADGLGEENIIDVIENL